METRNGFCTVCRKQLFFSFFLLVFYSKAFASDVKGQIIGSLIVSRVWIYSIWCNKTTAITLFPPLSFSTRRTLRARYEVDSYDCVNTFCIELPGVPLLSLPLSWLKGPGIIWEICDVHPANFDPTMSPKFLLQFGHNDYCSTKLMRDLWWARYQHQLYRHLGLAITSKLST